MNTFDCMADMEQMGYAFELAAGGRVLIRLMGNIRPPAEAGERMAFLKEHRAEVVSELHARRNAAVPLLANRERTGSTCRRHMPTLLDMYVVKSAEAAGVIEILRVVAHSASGRAEVLYRPVIPDEWIEWDAYSEMAKDLIRAELADMLRRAMEAEELSEVEAMAPKYADLKQALADAI